VTIVYSRLSAKARAAGDELIHHRRLFVITFMNLLHDSRIVLDHDFGCVVLAVDRKLHLISAGFEWRAGVEEAAEADAAAAATAATAAATTSTECRSVSGTRRWIAAHVPLNAIDPGVFCGDEIPYDFAGVITDGEFNVTGGLGLQLVADRRSWLRIWRAEPL